MTRRTAANSVFLKLGSSKFETDRELAKRFAAACKQRGVSQTHVFRQIIWEFCEAVERLYKHGG